MKTFSSSAVETSIRGAFQFDAERYDAIYGAYELLVFAAHERGGR